MGQTLGTSQGDTLAFDIQGTGPELIFVAGAGPFREIDPITLDRELSALEALIVYVGGTAAVCGHSSGAAIALRAAMSGLSINSLAIWEVPFVGSPEATQLWAQEYTALLASGDKASAIEHFTKDMPPEFREWLKTSPLWEVLIANANSQQPDAEALVWFESAPLIHLLDGLTIPVVAMVGETTFDEMHLAADAIATAVPGATKQVMPGAHHQWEPETMADQLAKLFI